MIKAKKHISYGKKIVLAPLLYHTNKFKMDFRRKYETKLLEYKRVLSSQLQECKRLLKLDWERVIHKEKYY